MLRSNHQTSRDVSSARQHEAHQAKRERRCRRGERPSKARLEQARKEQVAREAEQESADPLEKM